MGETVVLRGMAIGDTLKAHRYLDGRKVHRMHSLQGGTFVVEERIVTSLKRKGYIESNMKFPAATYLLTGRGRQLAAQLDS